jgi:hypothetical protein
MMMKCKPDLGECAPVKGHDEGVTSIPVMILMQQDGLAQQSVQCWCVLASQSHWQHVMT